MAKRRPMRFESLEWLAIKRNERMLFDGLRSTASAQDIAKAKARREIEDRRIEREIRDDD
jgi:hypothetical protein